MFRASVGGGAASSTRYRHPLVRAMSALLGAALPAGRPRRGGWSVLSLVLVALLASWDDGPALLDRFASARALVGRGCAGTYQGFAKALRRQGAALVGRVRRALTARVRAQGALWTMDGWAVFAIDASNFDVPRTLANEMALGVPGKKGAPPRIFATVLVHLGSGVLWDWRLARGDTGERRGMLSLLSSVPKGSLLVADAGFVGYECLKAVVHSGRHVLVRLAGNTVLTAGLSGRRDVVALWPRWRGQEQRSPLWLRVVRVRGRDGREVVLGTSVLDRHALADEQAACFYRLRWGVEVCYRSLKQTLRRRKLLSASPRRAVMELHWTMLGLMTLGLLALARIDPRLDRRRWSVAAAARAVRHAAHARGPAQAERHLRALRHALCGDNARRRKTAWEWPRKKRCEEPGPPVVRKPTAFEVANWRRLATELP